MPKIPLTQPNAPLHLYRHLLREASYLPPPCRPYITGRIQERFQRNRNEREPAGRLRTARHDLRYLRAANGGDLERMKRVVQLCFGRIGHRRRVLITDLLRKDGPVDTAELETRLGETLVKAPSDIEPDWLDNWDLDRLKAFAKSQGRTHLPDTPRSGVNPSSRVDPSEDVPELNAWRKPWKPSVLRSKQRKYWKAMVNRVLPPLPRGDWEMLRGLADGSLTGPAWDPPPRRVPAAPVLGAEEGDSTGAWDWKEWALRSARMIELKNSRSAKALYSTPGEDTPADSHSAIGVHRRTPRLWRRLFARTWHMSAMMEKDAGGARPKITWGRPSVTVSKPTDRQHELFAGIAADGKLPATAAQKRTRKE